MVYEVRKWFDEYECLYTDDRRVKDMAVLAPELRIVARYFQGAGAKQPFAWDIVGPSQVLAAVTKGVHSRPPGSGSRAVARSGRRP